MISFIKADDYQKLQLANDLFPTFHEGGKRITLHKGHRGLNLGSLLFVSAEPVERIGEDWDIYCERGGNVYMCHVVNVIEIRYKRFQDITNEEAQTDRFDDLDLGPNSVIMFVYFEVPGGLTNSKECSMIELFKEFLKGISVMSTSIWNNCCRLGTVLAIAIVAGAIAGLSWLEVNIP